MELSFEVYGHGEPLIMLHGLFGSLENWRSVGARLAVDFKVFAVDQRNHGRSPHSFEMDYRSMAGDVRRFIKSQNLADAFVLGHSMGGKTAMQLALLHPALVRKLVVADIAPHSYPPLHAQALAGMLALDLNHFQTRKEIEIALAPSVADIITRQFLLKNVMRDSTGGFRWKSGLQEINNSYVRLTEEVSAGAPFERPALFLRGEKSKYLLRSDLGLIQGLFPRALLQNIPGAGHLLHTENPQAFVKAVREFLLES